MFRRFGNSQASKESDRFITSRSSEREKTINRFLLKERDEKNLNKLQNLETPTTICKSAEPKTKTPFIIRDQKQLSDKIYLSLLKTQLFKSRPSIQNTSGKYSYKRSLKKKRKKSSIFDDFSRDKEQNPSNIKVIKNFKLSDTQCSNNSTQIIQNGIDMSFTLKCDENSIIEIEDYSQKKINA